MQRVMRMVYADVGFNLVKVDVGAVIRGEVQLACEVATVLRQRR